MCLPVARRRPEVVPSFAVSAPDAVVGYAVDDDLVGRQRRGVEVEAGVVVDGDFHLAIASWSVSHDTAPRPRSSHPVKEQKRKRIG